MKIIYFITFIGLVSADKLAHRYFPAPASAKTAGGYNHNLVAPSYYGQQQEHFGSGVNLNKILRNDFHSDGIGNYDYAYHTDNGINHNEEGHVQYDDDKVVKGSYSYTGDDGKVYTVNYYADASGFHATGDHLPGNNAGYPGAVDTSYHNKPTHRPSRPLAHRPTTQQVSGHRPSSGSKQFGGYPYPKPSTAYLPVF